MRIRVLLADADPVATSTVRSRLRLHPDFDVICETSSGEDAIARIHSLQPDAVFVDVGVLESCGLDVIALLCLPVRPVIVFLTEHAHYAVQAFDLGVADYLLKPIGSDRFEVSLDRVREQVAHRRVTESALETKLSTLAHPHIQQHSLGRITVSDRRRTHVIEAIDIEWIGAAGDYTELHVHGATHLLREPLSVLLRRLPADVFCRIHRSFVVNLSKVSGFKTLRNQDLLVKLKDKTVLRASRTFSEELKRAVRQHCAWPQLVASEQSSI
ncbi:LytR/AlgR family response regulator transcription factor [Acidicapsa ligni]|uniref:LytR/AlgR family response regulator transcription factor n=1 Tax=Acidicapsa ligni TaxID=542300 RepID=UPI0021DF9ACE|nr:LytTR family DNA-binding domain-containing protein [Acidicapsa ligni]